MIVTNQTDLNDFKMIGECMKCMFLASHDCFLTLDDDKGAVYELSTNGKRQFICFDSWGWYQWWVRIMTPFMWFIHIPLALDLRETPGRRQGRMAPIIDDPPGRGKCYKVKRGKASWELFLVLFNFHSAFWNPVFIQLNSWAHWRVVTLTVAVLPIKYPQPSK